MGEQTEKGGDKVFAMYYREIFAMQSFARNSILQILIA
jgi:hypothetical protein